VITKTVEVTQEQLISYEGNYSFYLKEKELREEIQQGAYENQQAKIRQTERFIERFKAKATKARQVQSRVKALDRMDLVDEVVNDTAEVNFRCGNDEGHFQIVRATHHLKKQQRYHRAR
jgi:ATP-binding cassette, subfamily F, member 3